MDLVTDRRLRDALPLFSTVAIFALILVLAAILSLGREIFVPIALAVILSFVLAPGVRALQRRRVPQSVSIILVVLAAFAGITLAGWVVASQLADLAADLPRYRTTMKEKIGSIGGAAAATGTMGRALEVLGEISAEIAGIGQSGPKAALDPDQRPIIVKVDESGGALKTLGLFVSPLLHPLATTGLVLILAVFILAQREDLRNRFIRLAGTEDLHQTTAAIDDAGRRLSRLFLTQLAVNVGFGFVIGLGLWAIGVPSPFLWGILAGVLRFVPYVGAIIAAGLPMLLAVAVDPGWSMLVWTAALFLIVEPAAGHIVEPLLYGQSTGLSPIAVVVAAMLWAFLWGPVGLVLATPLTVCLIVLGRYVGRLEFLGIMLGDEPALSPAQIFYQRMLAGDPTEAIEQAREFLQQRALSTYYDEVALEGIRLAHADVARGAISPERQDVMRQATEELVAALDAISDLGPRAARLGAETSAAVHAAGPDREGARVVRHKTDLAPAWQGRNPVVCVGRRGTLDGSVALMLAQVFTKRGLNARVLDPDEIGTLSQEEVRREGVALVCFSFVEPLSTTHLRYASREVHRRVPGARVVIGIWRERDDTAARALGAKTRADALVTTIHGALAAGLALSAPQGATAHTGRTQEAA